MIEIILIGFLSIAIPFWALPFFNRWLPRWFCEHLGHWHLAPIVQGFDGCSCNGTCPRCGKKVMQDSQGNWF